MALIKCKECGNSISEKARICPKCKTDLVTLSNVENNKLEAEFEYTEKEKVPNSQPINQHFKAPKKRNSKFAFIVVIFVFVVGGIYWYFMYNREQTNNVSEIQIVPKEKFPQVNVEDNRTTEDYIEQDHEILCEYFPLKISASSSLPTTSNHSYYPENLLDGNIETTWAAKPPIGQSINAVFNCSFRLRQLVIYNGMIKSESLYYRNSRVKELAIYLDENHINNFVLDDIYSTESQTINMDVVLPLKESILKIVIKDTFKGTHYDEVVLTDIKFIGERVYCE